MIMILLGKEKFVGSVMLVFVLFLRKFSDVSKKEMISFWGFGLVLEGVNISGILNLNSELGVNGGSDFVVEEVIFKKFLFRGLLDGKIKKFFFVCLFLKYRFDLVFIKGRVNLNVD